MRNGAAAEITLAAFFVAQGCRVLRMPSGHSFDLLVDGVRVEVKSCRRRGKTGLTWKFGLSKTDKSHIARITALQSGQTCDIICLLETDGRKINKIRWIRPSEASFKRTMSIGAVPAGRITEVAIPLISEAETIRSLSREVTLYAQTLAQ